MRNFIYGSAKPDVCFVIKHGLLTVKWKMCILMNPLNALECADSSFVCLSISNKALKVSLLSKGWSDATSAHQLKTASKPCRMDGLYDQQVPFINSHVSLLDVLCCTPSFQFQVLSFRVVLDVLISPSCVEQKLSSVTIPSSRREPNTLHVHLSNWSVAFCLESSGKDAWRETAERQEKKIN